MPILDYISDENLYDEVRRVIDIAIQAKAGSAESFGDNIIDPFAALFEVSGFGIDYNTWKASEMVRQSQKTLQNHVGTFHQNILGFVNDWENLVVGREVDLLCSSRKIIAEVKNKYNTVSGGKLKDMYSDLEKLVMPKASTYKDYTAYFVMIVPKRSKRFDKPFTPPNKTTGSRCTENPLIRQIDGASFYQLVTGREHALKELFDALPGVIAQVCRDQHGATAISPEDQTQLQQYFTQAYNKK